MKTKKPLPKGRRLGTSNRGILIKGRWKAVELDPSLFADEGMGGLVCFEELTDYKLVNSDRALIAAEEAAGGPEKEEKKKKKKKKRKASEMELEEEEDKLGEEDGDSTEQAEALGEDEDIEHEGLEGDETDIIEKPAKKKKRQRKKKKKPSDGDKTVTSNTTADAEEMAQEEAQTANQSAPEDQPLEGDLEATSKSQEQETEDNKPSAKSRKKAKRKKKEKKPPSSDVKAPAASQDPTSTSSPPPALPKKKKVKNWSSGSLGGSSGRDTDVSAWKDLFVPTPVLEALSKLGFSAPTPIQTLALPPAIRDHMDILGAAETGSGKTLSFGIPVIHNILEWKRASENWRMSQMTGPSDTAPQKESAGSPPVGEATADAAAAVEDESSNSDAKQGQFVQAAEEAPAVVVTDPDAEGQENAVEGEDDAEKKVVEQEEEEEDGLEDDASGVQSDDTADDSDGEDKDDERGCVQIMNAETEVGKSDKGDTKGGDKQPLLALILTPTRELAVQVKHHIDAVAQFTGIRTAIIVGGMAPQKQNRVLSRRPEIVIATPGRLWDLIKEGHPHLQNLRHLRSLVIDEADRMVERGHFAELENLLEMLNTSQFNPKRQTFVFSATLTMVHSLPLRLQHKKGKKVEPSSKLDLLMQKVGIKDKPKVIDLTRKEATVETLTETRIHCEKEEKDLYLYYFLLQYPGRTMVFANSIDCIKRLNSLLVILDQTPLPLHANMHQKQRLKNLERFAERDSCVLLTTDVAARGLDIPNVQHVIHYQVPRTSETYVHRSGRTARATKQGLSLLLIGPDDLMNYKKIYRTLGKDEDLPMFPIQTKCMAAIKERVKLAWSIEKVEYHNSRQKQHNSWFKQAAEAMEIDLDDDMLIAGDRDEEDDIQQQKMVKGMKKHLKHLLSQPVFRNDMKTKYPTQMGRLRLPELPLASMETALTSVAKQNEIKKQWRNKKPKKS